MYIGNKFFDKLPCPKKSHRLLCCLEFFFLTFNKAYPLSFEEKSIGNIVSDIKLRGKLIGSCEIFCHFPF